MAVSSQQFEEVSGPTFLTGVQCTGQETTLSSCRSSTLELEGCTDRQYAAVMCDPSFFGNEIDYIRHYQKLKFCCFLWILCVDCGPGLFTCPYDQRCLDESVMCDGFPDCAVNTLFGVSVLDESVCPQAGMCTI